MDRRQFLILSSAATLAGCGSSGRPMGNAVQPPGGGPIHAGSVDAFAADGIYPAILNSGRFFIVRENRRLFALLAVCPHRACKISAEQDHFACDCHGSTFTLGGKVTRGPARRDLWRLPVSKDGNGHLIVHADRLLSADQADGADAFVHI
jgi:cytochrome b6-f complex iron-sulfur subunit